MAGPYLVEVEDLGASFGMCGLDEQHPRRGQPPEGLACSQPLVVMVKKVNNMNRWVLCARMESG